MVVGKVGNSNRVAISSTVRPLMTGKGWTWVVAALIFQIAGPGLWSYSCELAVPSISIAVKSAEEVNAREDQEAQLSW